MKLKKIFCGLILGGIIVTSCDRAKEEVFPSIIELIDDEFDTIESTPIVLDILNNDKIEGIDISVELSNPNNGIITLHKDELTFLYTPNEDFLGEENLIYTVCGGDNCKEAKIKINVELKKQELPDGCLFLLRARTDNVIVKEKVEFEIDLIENDDFCLNNVDLSSFSIVENIKYGKILSSNNGKISFIMDENFYLDELVYSICTLEGDCDNGTLVIKNAANSTPTIK